MSRPKITELFNGYKLEWQDEQIAIETTHLKQKSDGIVSGEVTISTSAPGVPSHLHRSHFNLSSERSRTSLAKTLKERHNSLDWHGLLEQNSVYVIDMYRRGEPVRELKSTDEIQRPRYLLNPLIIENYPNVIFGDPSSAKSTLAVILSQVMQLPWHDNPMGITAPASPVKVLYIDWESDWETINWQLKTLENGMGLGYLSLHYRRCYFPLAQDIEQIKKYVEETEATLLIIDSLGIAAGGELKETQSPLAFFGALRQLGRTSLILAHNNKEDIKKKTIFGSQFFTALARNVWEIRKSQDTDSDEMELALFHKKPPPFSKLQKPIGFKIEFDNELGKMEVKKHDPRNVAEFIERMTDTDRVLDALRDGPMDNKELTDELEMKPDNVRVATNRLKKKELIVKVGSQWGLAAREG